ncbi:MAG TPA: rhombosortase [Solimonas sp.]|nr:rhombosortase [Solimonas sp.]
MWATPIAVALLCAVLELGGEPLRALLAWDRGLIGAGQWWRLLTGNFVHLGPYHLLLNVLGLLVLVLLCPQRLSAWRWLLRLLVLGLAVGLGLLLFAPQWQRYVGLSGVLHGLFLLGLVPQLRRGDRIALVALLYLFGKLAWEMWSGVPVSDERALGGRVVLESHLFGTLGALVYGLAFEFFISPQQPPAASMPQRPQGTSDSP